MNWFTSYELGPRSMDTIVYITLNRSILTTGSTSRELGPRFIQSIMKRFKDFQFLSQALRIKARLILWWYDLYLGPMEKSPDSMIDSMTRTLWVQFIPRTHGKVPRLSKSVPVTMINNMGRMYDPYFDPLVSLENPKHHLGDHDLDHNSWNRSMTRTVTHGSPF